MPDSAPTGDWTFGNVLIRPSTRDLFVNGKPAVIGARAFDVLLTLVEHRGRVVTKGELLDLVWPNQVVEENNLQVQISTLRKVLGASTIATISGRGYRFAGEVVEQHPSHTIRTSTEDSAGGSRPSLPNTAQARGAPEGQKSGLVPEGDVRLTANIRADLHLKLKIRAVNERTTVGELIENWIESWR